MQMISCISKSSGALVLALAFMLCLVSGCGSTSNLVDVDGQPAVFKEYPRVVVMTLTPVPEDPVKKPEVTEGCGLFTTKLVEALKVSHVAPEIAQDDRNIGGSLVLSGCVTRYEKGDAAARLLWGFGAGSSYLDATLLFKDGDTGQELGRMVVDRNSWGLGGIIASTQTAESFAEDAAKKVAAELQRATKSPRAQ